MNPDRVINSPAELVANFQILRREPAAHTAVLQIIIQPFGKHIILTAVTDEARVILKWTTRSQLADLIGDVGHFISAKPRLV